jgi:hypothetical protein
MFQETSSTPETGRRKFLAQCGKFAILTPPAITVLLSMTDQSFAHASSGGGGYGGGKGGHDHDHGSSGGGNSSGGSYKPPVGGGKGGYKPGSYSHLTDEQKHKIAAAGHDLLADLLGKLGKH